MTKLGAISMVLAAAILGGSAILAAVLLSAEKSVFPVVVGVERRCRLVVVQEGDSEEFLRLRGDACLEWTEEVSPEEGLRFDQSAVLRADDRLYAIEHYKLVTVLAENGAFTVATSADVDVAIGDTWASPSVK